MNKDNILPVLREESEKLYAANKQKNKFAAEERKYTTELDYLMADLYEGKEGSFEHTFRYDDREVNIEVAYEQKVTDTVDVHKLFSEVDEETFLNIVTASRAAVERVAGKNIANRVISTKLSDFKTRLKEKK